MKRFKNRKDAAKKLVSRLKKQNQEYDLILAIPRGGVPLAKVVSQSFSWQLELIVTKKIGTPGRNELAMGAIAENGEPIWHRQVLSSISLSTDQKKQAVKKTRQKISRYIKEFRDGKSLDVSGKRVLIVDDGVATGMTLKAAIKWLKEKQADKIAVALPVAAKDTAQKLKKQVDSWACLIESANFYAVGQFYQQFSQVSDKKVKTLLSL